MKTVKVSGELAKFLGSNSFKFDVATPAEAIQALLVNFKGLEQWLLDSEKNGVAYNVKVGKEKIYKDNINDLNGFWSNKDVFSIRPIIQGAGRGFTKFLTGALLLGVGFAVGGGLLGAKLAAYTKAISFVKKVGWILAIGGVSEMLSPQDKIPDIQTPNLSESFSLSGLRNISHLGTAVPIAYGRVFVGSTIISTGLDTDEVAG